MPGSIVASRKRLQKYSPPWATDGDACLEKTARKTGPVINFFDGYLSECPPRVVAQGFYEHVKSVSGVYAKEVVLIKKWFPLILLVVFTVISITALSGLARNLAQKRTLFSDPLCRVVWKKKKLHRMARNLTQASDLITVKK